MSSSSDLQAPVLLLAMPQVLDPSFFRSVVLLLHHDAEGSFGLIVNRPTETPLSKVLQELSIRWWGLEGAVVHFGGPVQPQLGTVLFMPEGPVPSGEATTEVLAGVGMSHHVGDLQQLSHQPPVCFRLFLGYSAWGAGQLMDEILRNDWLTAPVDLDLVFAADPGTVWETALRSVNIDPTSLPSWTGAADEEETN